MSNLTIPNILSVSRMVMAPMTIALHYHHFITASAIFFLATVLSDLLDGAIARRLGQETSLGALLDPVADRILAISMYSYVGYHELAPAVLVGIILIRNVAQLMSIPILIGWLKKSFNVKPKPLSKWGTVLSDVFLIFPLFWHSVVQNNPFYIASILIIGVAIMECILLVQYVPRLIQIAIGTHDTFE